MWEEGSPLEVRSISVSGALIAVLVAVLLGFFPGRALADTASAITSLPVLDPLNRSESPLSDGGKWSALAWDTSGSGHNTGRDTEGGWGPYDAFSTVNGAYWNPSTFGDSGGDAAAMTMETAPGITSRYVALWLEMPNPGGAKSGYQLRWTSVSGSTYEVTLAKWSSGTQTVLAENAAVEIPIGTTLAISDTGGTVTAWKGTQEALNSFLSASDSAYSEGYAGIEGAGNISRSQNFKAGSLVDLGSAITSLPVLDPLNRSESPLSDGGKWSALAWDTSGSGHNTGRDTEGGWGPYDAFSTVNGAYWNPSTFGDSGGDAAAMTMETAPGITSRYVALWLEMPNPGGAKSGYQLRWTSVSGSTYEVTLAKWSSGTQTVLAENAAVEIPIGTTLAISDTGGTVTAWKGTQEALNSFLSASDSAYSEGYAGIEGAGNISRSQNFKAGESLNSAPVTITEGAAAVNADEAILEGSVNPNGSSTSYQFEYGTSASYGSTVPVQPQELGGGEEKVELSEGLSGLEAETTYHYRIRATNSVGTSVGADRVFNTSANAQPFFGFQFGAYTTTSDEDLEAVERSGAKYWRLGFGCTTSHSEMDTEVELAWKHHLHIIANPSDCNLPGENNGQYPTYDPSKSLAEQSAKWMLWEESLRYLLHRFGNGGSFWQEQKRGAHEPLPITVWEIWNEPNRGASSPGGYAQPEEYGRFFKRSAEIINNDQGAGNTTVLMGGLLTQVTGYEGVGGYYNVNVDTFLQGTHAVNGIGEEFDGVSVHPYAFKKAGFQTIALHVAQNIANDREWVDSTYSAAKGLWITEAGWPVNPPWDDQEPCKSNFENTSETFPGLTPAEQGAELNGLLYWVESYREADRIKSMLYYNYRDHQWNCSWDNFAGLREQGEGEGSFRPAWYTFQEHAGAERWPVAPGAVTGGASEVGAKKATASGTSNPHGLGSHMQIDYGTSKLYGASTSSVNVGYGTASIAKSQTITGLRPSTTYHYRVAVTNGNGETTHGVDRTFTTQASTKTTMNENIEALNGNPGWVTISGTVSSPEEYDVNGYVSVELFKREGSNYRYQRTVEAPLVNGIYELRNHEVGTGEWEALARFPKQGELEESTSGYHKFRIYDGYNVVNRATGKCLDIAFESPDNASLAWLWDCHNPATNGQTFTLKPIPGYSDHFQIIARNSDKCVDIKNDSYSAGEQLQQWACASPIPTVQEWKRFGSANNGWGFAIQHTGQCMDDWESGSGNGNKIDQWPCNGTAAQGWKLEPVEAPPVTTHVNPNTPEVLPGEPGLVTFGGQVDLSGYPTGGATVHVNLAKKINGSYQFQQDESFSLEVNSSGHWERDYWGVGPGEWQVNVVFDGNSTLGRSESGDQHFTVHKGYHLINQTTGKCLSINEGSSNEGAKALLWDCSGNPQNGDGQLITKYPMISNWPYYQLRFNDAGGPNAGKCLTVPGHSQSEGEQLIQYSCISESEDNQLWSISGGSEYFQLHSKNTGQCVDDWLSSSANGNKIDQWGCNGTGAQNWKFVPVG